ncbi:MAG TPA: S1/P1 nuclease [Salinimicrobium sp.]|nr:S1/P1 nuclease [Salinimicrobium sp.]
MKYLLFISIFFLSFTVSANNHVNDWGQTGHRTTGKIAEQYLSRKAKKQIDKILDGQSLAFVSTFGDDIKSDPQYRKYGPWHYVNLAEGETEYTSEDAAEGGDLIFGIRKCISVLENEKASKEEKAFHLKLLVHFLGDLHQPMHTGRGEDKGGNDIQLQFFNKGTNLHRVWDSDLIESFGMSFSELAKNAPELDKDEVKKIAEGNILNWMMESKKLSDQVYASVEIGEKLYYDYGYKWFPVVHQQLQKGGIRLASLLNEIFD